jgi:hypothetical protein
MKQQTSDNSKLPESMKRACCATCLLAESMKDCKNCPFNQYIDRRDDFWGEYWSYRKIDERVSVVYKLSGVSRLMTKFESLQYLYAIRKLTFGESCEYLAGITKHL